MITRHPARSRLLVASALAALVLAACGGDDDASPAASSSTTTSMATFATLATVPVTAAPATEPPASTTEPEPVESTYTIVAGDSLFAIADREGITLDALVQANGWTDGIDHLILPGDEIIIPSASASETDGSTATTPETGEEGGYADAAIELTLTGDRSTAIAEPLTDGIYFSDEYSSDGSAVTFVLTQYFLCDSSTNVPDEPDIVCASGFGTLDEPSTTAALSPGADVTVATGDLSDLTFASVTSDEFTRLVAGESPSADAPDGYQFDDFFTFVRVGGGEVVAVEQFYTS